MQFSGLGSSKMEFSEIDFFHTLTIQNDQISYVKHVLAPLPSSRCLAEGNRIFIFPLRKILSLPSLLLCTLYVYVFSSVVHVICVAGRFLFLCSQNVIHSWGHSFRQW